MSPPSPIDSLWEAIGTVNERIDKIITLLERDAPPSKSCRDQTIRAKIVPDEDITLLEIGHVYMIKSYSRSDGMFTAELVEE